MDYNTNSIADPLTVSKQPILDQLPPFCVWVPCIPDLATNSFIPICSIFNYSQEQKHTQDPVKQELKVQISRGGVKYKPWKEFEDNLLLELIGKYGTKQWAKISNDLNKTLHKSNLVRKGKHCRERWINHLNPELNSKLYLEGEWTYEEDLILLEQRQFIGSKWSVIAKALSGRTENGVKNRWNSLIKNAKQLKSLHYLSDDAVASILIAELRK